MATPRELVDELRTRLAEHVDGAERIGATFKFHVFGESGGTWRVQLRPPAGVLEDDGQADCTIRMDDCSFVDLFEGRVNGQQLFFAGKLDIEGDLTLALKLQELTSLLRQPQT